MQLQDIRTEIRDTAGLASDDARFSDTILTRVINRALRSLSAEHDWPWNQASETISTVASTQAYSPAAAWVKTSRLRYDNHDLVHIQARDSSQYQNDTGSPVAYFIEEDKINMVPTPDGVYSVTHIYSAYETALSGATDEPAMPDRYVDYLVQTALVQIAQRIRDTELYSIADRERRGWYRRASDETMRSSASMKIKTRNDWWL